jgi:hypothetical protein
MAAPNLTLDELVELAATAADPDHGCFSCDGLMPGIQTPMLPDGDDAHPFVEWCDECQTLFRDKRTGELVGDPALKLYKDDEDAARAFAKRFGLNVRRRYDDESLRYYRIFLARPGSPDDRDWYCVGADEFGCFPDEERPVRIQHRIAALRRRLPRTIQRIKERA